MCRGNEGLRQSIDLLEMMQDPKTLKDKRRTTYEGVPRSFTYRREGRSCNLIPEKGEKSIAPQNPGSSHRSPFRGRPQPQKINLHIAMLRSPTAGSTAMMRHKDPSAQSVTFILSICQQPLSGRCHKYCSIWLLKNEWSASGNELGVQIYSNRALTEGSAFCRVIRRGNDVRRWQSNRPAAARRHD